MIALAGIVLGSVGLLLLGIAYLLWTRTKGFMSQAQPVKGTVVRMASDSEGAYAPIFRFMASNGETIEKHAGMYSKPPEYKVGDIVDVLYDPGNPHGARIAKTSSMYFAPILLAVMGIIFIGIAAAILGLKLLDLFF